MVDRRIETH